MHHLKGHENICLLHAAYEDKHHVHLVRLVFKQWLAACDLHGFVLLAYWSC